MQFLAGRKLRASELNYDTETGVDCHYQAPTAQTLPSLAITPLAFGTAVRTTPLVTRSVHATVGHKFTVARGGLWKITCAVRIASGGVAGSRFLGIWHAGSGLVQADHGVTVSNTGPISLPIMGSFYLAANDAVYAAMYVDGGAQATEATNNWVSWRMAWEHD